jgi:hypothetical protein
MRYVLIFWGLPMGLFWGWYFLSLNDVHFGYLMLSRQVHDLVFQLYGEMLGIDPATIPPLVAKACVFDTFLIAGIVAFRRRRKIADWVRESRSRYLAGDITATPEGGRAPPAE